MLQPAQSSPAVLLCGLFLSKHGGRRSPIEDLADRLTGCGWSCICSSSIPNGLLRGADVLRAALLNRGRYQVAVVDLFSGKAFLWGEAVGKLLRMLGVPFVYSMHGGALPEFAHTRAERVTRCLARAAAVTAPSPYLLETMKSYRPDALLVPNAIETARYRFRLRQKAAPRLIWVRRFHEIYNPAMAVEVLAELLPRFPSATLTMVGGDSDGSYDRVLRLARDRGVFQQIRFLGAVPRESVGDYLAEADVFVNTTNIDNTPVSILEALAAGLCVVTTDAGGLPYLLNQGTEALLTPCGDAPAMAAGVARLLTDPSLAEQLSGNGRRKAATFDWPIVLGQWKELLARVSGVHPQPHRPYLVPGQPERV